MAPSAKLGEKRQWEMTVPSEVEVHLSNKKNSDEDDKVHQWITELNELVGDNMSVRRHIDRSLRNKR